MRSPPAVTASETAMRPMVRFPVSTFGKVSKKALGEMIAAKLAKAA